jgi:integrase
VNGRQIQESTHQSDEKEAQRLLNIKLGEAAAGKYVAPEKATVSDLCALVVADHETRKLRESRSVGYRIKNHIKPAIGSLLASQFTPHQVRQYIKSRRAEKAADGTINRELAILRRGFNLGIREEPPLVHRAIYIQMLHEDNVRQGFIEESQYTALRNALPDWLKAMLVVGYRCGPRFGELTSLERTQVDWGAMEIRVYGKQTKSKRPHTMPIYDDMIEWLRWQEARTPKDCKYVFHLDGEQIRDHVFYPAWNEACNAAGLPGLHFHDLRRSAVRNFENGHTNRKVAMGFTGHLTEAIYLRYNIVANQDLHAAAAQMTKYHEQKRRQLAQPQPEAEPAMVQ